MDHVPVAMTPARRMKNKDSSLMLELQVFDGRSTFFLTLLIKCIKFLRRAWKLC